MDSVGDVECAFVAKRNRNREQLRLVWCRARVHARTFCTIRKICRKKSEICNLDLRKVLELDSAFNFSVEFQLS
jgi:hypothetical protein